MLLLKTLLAFPSHFLNSLVWLVPLEELGQDDWEFGGSGARIASHSFWWSKAVDLRAGWPASDHGNPWETPHGLTPCCDPQRRRPQKPLAVIPSWSPLIIQNRGWSPWPSLHNWWSGCPSHPPAQSDVGTSKSSKSDTDTAAAKEVLHQTSGANICDSTPFCTWLQAERSTSAAPLSLPHVA